MNQRDRRISDQLVRLVQIIFGVVLAQSLMRNSDVLLHPLVHRVALFALAVVYITTVLSWIDWHTTMEMRPYNFNPKNQRILIEKLRLWSDLLVVIMYVYLLFTTAPLVDNGGADIGRHLIGYPAVFFFYFMSGVTRKWAYGRYASHTTVIAIFGVLFLLLALGYMQYRTTLQQHLPFLEDEWLNAVALFLALAAMLSYRSVRARLSKRRKQRKAKGLKIGIDIDGVLADQIHGILPRIRQRLGVALRYEDVTDWRLPIKQTDIAKEIVAAMDDDRDYVLGMPPHDGAKEVLEALYRHNEIALLTARARETEDSTRQWLDNNALVYDSEHLVFLKEGRKSLHDADVLVDDYLGNIEEYLTNTRGIAILIEQPWNKDRSKVADWISEGRLYVVPGLRAAQSVIDSRRASLLEAKATARVVAQPDSADASPTPTKP